MSKGKSRASTWFIIALVFIILAAAGAGYAFAWRTFVVWWEPLVIAVCLGSAIGSLLSRKFGRLLGTSSRPTAIAASMLTMSAVIYGAMMTLNYTLADKTTEIPIEATVICRHSEERTKYRRSGRNRMRADGHYKAYYITIRFADGTTRDIPASAGNYTRTVIGSKRHFTAYDGFLGYKIFSPDSPRDQAQP